ncbi:MAG: DEAD/DEAH box helicase [Pseudomonadota bacterium]
MTEFFRGINKSIAQWCQAPRRPMKIQGITSDQWSFLLHFFWENDLANFRNYWHLVICPNTETAENFFDQLPQNIAGLNNFYFFPGLEVSPYSNILSPEKNLFSRFGVLSELLHPKAPLVIVTSLESFNLKLPPKDFFIKKHFTLTISDILPPEQLAQKLFDLGYFSSTSVEEQGTFSRKGEIFDIYPIAGPPVRLSYFDEMIEKITEIDLGTQKSMAQKELNSINIDVSPKIFSRAGFSNTLRANIPMPAPLYKKRFEKRKQIFESLAEGQLFENYSAYTPLFFTKNDQLLDYFPKDKTFIHILGEDFIAQRDGAMRQELEEQFQGESNDPESDQLLPSPEQLFYFNQWKKSEFPTLMVNQLQIGLDIPKDEYNFQFSFTDFSAYVRQQISLPADKVQYLKSLLHFFKSYLESSAGEILFSLSNQGAREELLYLIDSENFDPSVKEHLHFTKIPLNHGFYYDLERVLVVSESDLFSRRQQKISRTQKFEVDLFAEQLAGLQISDFVVHNQYGVGKYLGLETLQIEGNKTDYLVIQYAENDKIYVPVYKMNLVQKHADASAQLSVANLRTNKFEQAKSRARNAVKQLAFDLLKLQAERMSAPAFAFSPPDHDFREFELDFPFEPTPDQVDAIEHVLEVMQRPTPMDVLVCGDVGFGKTEVAMRATYKAVQDGKQVAVLVPTTILALQHFDTFRNRFKNFPVTIEFLSRFKTAQQIKEIKEKMADGKVDVVIGTHMLLGDAIKFHDLGLVVVDEEHRFGVGHKEKLKLLKASIDFLTLTATPIPRTLQLAFLNLKDLCLIKTAPPNRQSIKTYIVREDEAIIQEAIENELQRGGQVFFVHNRVEDIEQYAALIQQLVPSAKIVIGHGQLSEKELESRIKDFYSGKYQILVCTTIIESGLDIPRANTMIVNRADTFGLAQLHQLRGRVGRSEYQSYCYLFTESTGEGAKTRLKNLVEAKSYS